MTLISESLVAQSPRLTPRPVPVISHVITIGAALLFAALVAQGFFRTGLASWSVGIVYILYDTSLLVFTARRTWRIMAPQPALAAAGLENGAARPSLGVIIAAHNEAGVLGITIDRLRAQSDPPDLIVVADDGSTDETPAVMQRLYGLAPPPLGHISAPAPGVPGLRWLRVPHGGKARALNAAIQQVDCEIVLTVDADTLLDDGALAAMRGAFAAEPLLVAATGVLTPICGPSLSGRLFQWFQTYEYVRNFLSRYAWMQENSLLLISGAFAAFRREALITVGGFDPACLVEDYELIHRLHRHSVDAGLGWRVRVIGQAHARTDAPATPMAFLRQRRRWFGGFLQTQYWNRDMIGNARFGALGTKMMPVKTLDTLQPVYGIAAFIILIAVVALGAWRIALPILLVMLAKILFDLAYHLWSLKLYARWTGQREGLGLGWALVAAVLEPFTFQLLRHAGALWGWHSFLTGRESWGRQRRTAIGAGVEARSRGGAL
ncbi:MAG: glycosyltransferase [Sphingomonas sp.]|jgi:cellulose synthase/poly-beta-1,6-N-acetylglucosamine synthase-like glycosyltransferase